MENTVLLVSYFSKTLLRIPTLQVSADDSDTAKMVQANSDNTFYVYNTTLDSTYPKNKAIPIKVKVEPASEKDKITKFQFTLGNDDFTRACEYPDVDNVTPTFTYTHPVAVSTKEITGNSLETSSDSDWTWPTDLFGGKVKKIKVKIWQGTTVTEHTITRSFYIVGSQIPDARIDAYVDTQNATISGTTYTWAHSSYKAILNQETFKRHYARSTYLAKTSHEYYPFKGGGTGDDGFGIGQLTPPSASEQIWNWKKNIDRGFNFFITTKRQAAELDLAGHTYTQEQLKYATVCRYNGGSYFVWSSTESKWIKRSDITCNCDGNEAKGKKDGGSCQNYGFCYANKILGTYTD